jgi:hypothetical protein
MNFDELYAQILEEKKKCKNPCLICHMNMDKEIVKLKCKHEYHINCLFHNKATNIKFIECPYCRSTDNISKYSKKCIAITKLTKCNKSTFMDNSLCNSHTNYKPNKCEAVLLRGKNKGSICGKSILLNDTFCSKHIKKKLDLEIVKKTCKSILTKGKNKGTICGKTCNEDFCKFHNNCNKKSSVIENTTTSIINNKINNVLCQAICKSGKNKNLPCKNKASVGEFCKKHKPKPILDIVI